MTNEQRAALIVGQWAVQFEAEANGGAGAFGLLTQRIVAALDEARVQAFFDGMERAKQESQKNHERPAET